MESLYSRLAKLGFPRPYVRRIAFPDWWDDEIAQSAAGFDECAILVSRHLGVDIAGIRTNAPDLTFQGLEGARFKKSENKSRESISVPCSVALRAACLAAAAIETPLNLERDPARVRSAILQQGHPWVSLEALSDYCWSIGIPVLHVSKFPVGNGASKMDGMAVQIDGRPVIIVSKNHKSHGWLLFILAHELGHICRNHLASGFVVDTKVDRNSEDTEEREADEFALHLLTGNPKCKYSISGPWPSAQKLATLAINYGRANQVDPTHIVLNYSHSLGDGFFKLANASLNILERSPNGMEAINKRVFSNLAWDALPEASSEFLAKVLSD